MKRKLAVISMILCIVFNYPASPIHAAAIFINVTTLGVSANSLQDQTNEIQQAIKTAQGKTLYFPAGKYFISRDIELSTGGAIYGEANGKTIISAKNASNMIYFNRTQRPSSAPDYNRGKIKDDIQYISFENIGISINDVNEQSITVQNNIFFNGKYSTATASKSEGEYYVFIKNNSNANISQNVMLRDYGYAGRGIGTYKTINTLIYDNYIGELSGSNKIISGAPERELTSILNNLKANTNLYQIGLKNGNFITAINSVNYDKGLKITGNYFNGSSETQVYSDPLGKTPIILYPNTPFPTRRDHIIYAKGYVDITISFNYMTGWENNASGGVKLRNGDSALIYRNVLEEVPILSYIYKGDVLVLNKTYILNNYFINKTKTKTNEILYWQDFVDSTTQDAKIDSYVVVGNTFDSIPDDLKKRDQIVLQPKAEKNRNNFYWENNKYSDNVALFPLLSGVQTTSNRPPLALQQEIWDYFGNYSLEQLFGSTTPDNWVFGG